MVMKIPSQLRPTRELLRALDWKGSQAVAKACFENGQRLSGTQARDLYGQLGPWRHQQPVEPAGE